MNPEFRYFCTVVPQEIITQLGEGTPINNSFNLIFWLMMGFNILAIALSKTLNPGYLSTLFKAALSNRQLMNNVREDIDIWRFTSVLLNFAYFNCLGIIVWKLASMDKTNLLFIITLVILGISILKLIVIRFISFIINSSHGTEEHLYNHFVFYQIGAILLTPILLFTNYVPASYVMILLIIPLGIVGLLLLVREWQTLTQAFQYKISFFYIILYLCTLEILPVLIGVRVFILNSGATN